MTRAALSMPGYCCYRSCRTYGLIAKYTDCIFASGYFPAVCSTCRTPRTRTSPPGSCGCARGSSGCTAWWTGAGSTCTRTRTSAASWDGSRPYRGCRCRFAAWRDTFWLLLGWWWERWFPMGFCFSLSVYRLNSWLFCWGCLMRSDFFCLCFVSCFWKNYWVWCVYCWQFEFFFFFFEGAKWVLAMVYSLLTSD